MATSFMHENSHLHHVGEDTIWHCRNCHQQPTQTSWRVWWTSLTVRWMSFKTRRR